MALESRLIEGVEVTEDSNSAKHTATFFVLEADLESMIPAVKSSVSWAPSDCVVTDYSKTYFGPGCWQVKVTASSGEAGFGAFTTTDMGDFVEKKYNSENITFNRDWWGVREAGSTDEEKKVLNIKGSACKQGELLFLNATTGSKGTPDYSLSPFKKESLNMSVDLMDQTEKTKVFECCFYDKRDVNNFADFVGVSNHIPLRCAPTPYATYKWLAVDQSLERVKDKNGHLWTRVRRVMKMAPKDFLWNPDKKGGLWSW
jgi:hypothetical protein